MVTTVSGAFELFMKNKVNLDSDDTSIARASRDNLIKNINSFSGDEDFFNVYKDYNFNYGSFARHTKTRPLDDIDLMICFSATNNDEKRTYAESVDCVFISGISFDYSNKLLTDGTNYLNSTKVINRLISKLESVNDYKKAEMHKNHEAATLNLKSYTWSYDIVPCFYTSTGLYLIPDGLGNWKKTDPRIDNKRITKINQKHQGKILEVIRLMKYWNNRKVTIRIPSYMLECMILDVYERMDEKDNYWIDWEIRDLFNELSSAIYERVSDPKGIQGDLNDFSFYERAKISSALLSAYEKSKEASALESIGQKDAINKWREVMGREFPEYME